MLRDCRDKNERRGAHVRTDSKRKIYASCIKALAYIATVASVSVLAAVPAYCAQAGDGPGYVHGTAQAGMGIDQAGSGIPETERAMLYDVYSGFLASQSGTYRTEKYYPVTQWADWPRALEVCYFHSVKPGAMKLYGTSERPGEYQVIIERTEDMDTVRRKEAEYDAEVAKLVALVEGKTVEEKIRFFHDYLTQKCSYDYSYSRSRAYDCLITGSSVCNGYAAAFHNLCEASGLEVNYIAGTVEVEGQGRVMHAWDRVKGSDGQWRYYDITFDDALKSDKYYGLTEDEMGLDHFQEQVV